MKETEKKQVILYTDGACSGNPGLGGYGGILLYGEHHLEYSGAEQETTNNRMEESRRENRFERRFVGRAVSAYETARSRVS